MFIANIHLEIIMYYTDWYKDHSLWSPPSLSIIALYTVNISHEQTLYNSFIAKHTHFGR